MSTAFDPYYQWLGIPPHEQPPDHYRLLGLAPFEPNPDVIESAADRQMAHVRSHQTGKHAAQSQELLNEIAAARRCLLAAEKKSEYDTRLKAQQPKPAREAKIVQSPGESGTSLLKGQPISAVPQVQTPRKPVPDGKPESSSPLPILLVGGAAVALLLLVTGVGAAFVLLRSPSEEANVTSGGGRVNPPPTVVQPPTLPPNNPTVANNRPNNNRPQNRFPGPSEPAPVVFNPNGVNDPPVSNDDPPPTGPLRATARAPGDRKRESVDEPITPPSESNEPVARIC